MNFYKTIQLSLLYLLIAHATAFSQDYSYVHPSPNIGWSLASLKQNNDLYTGKVNLNIPIYELNVGTYKLPVSLNYTTKSIAVDQLPSWVGLGWNLTAGGQITRVVKGKPDEMKDMKHVSITIVTIVGGYTSTQTTTYSIFTDNDFSYISNNTQLNTPQWSNSSYLQNTLGALPFVEWSLNEVITYADYPPYQWSAFNPIPDFRYNYDFEPDEYNFSIGGLNGTFYLAHDNTWRCETNQGNFKVDFSVVTEVQKGNRKIPRAINRFTLTGPDGTRYIFGSNDQNNLLKNIEFYRGPTTAVTGGVDRTFFDVYMTSYIPICPSSWMITRIETPDNQYIDFEYKREGFQVIYSDAPRGEGSPTSFTRLKPGFIEQSLAEPQYLTKITASNGISIDITSQLSSQLGSDKRIDNLSQYSSFLPNSEIASQLVNQNNNLQKVTSIDIKDNNLVKKKYEFEYIENLSERLKLKSIKQVMPGSTITNQNYNFYYHTGVSNSELLPDYGSGKVDHFGYYNNKRFFADNIQTIYPLSRTAFETQYFDSREPDFQYAKNEVLEKIVFPTGGYREFTYEPNDYISNISRWPFTITTNSTNKLTGGIRVAKITDYSSVGVKANEVEYIYKTSVNGSVSSGVFSIPISTYTVNNSSGGYNFEAKGFIPFNRERSHITYSTVFEKFPNGGYKKYNYSNFDNGINDEVPIFETSAPAYEDQQTFTSHQFKRGLLLSEEIFNNVDQSVEKTNLRYQYEFDNYSRAIRNVRIRHNNFNNTGYRSAAYSTFYFPNVLRENKMQTFASSNILEKKIDYLYDIENNLQSQTTTNSKGEQLTRSYTYPYNLATLNPQNPYTILTTKNIKRSIVEEKSIVTLSGQSFVTQGTVQEYVDFGNGIIKPKNIFTLSLSEPKLLSSIQPTQYNNTTNSLTIDPSYLLNKVELGFYNGVGNHQQVKPMNGIDEIILYGYKNKYPVAKIVNSDYYTVIGFIDQSILDNPSSDQALREELNKIRVGLAGTLALVETYTYSPLFGKTSETNSSGRTTYYEYDAFGRVSKKLDENHNILNSYEYNFKN